VERRKGPLRRFTQNSLKGRERSISYIYCERLNRLLRNLNDLTTTTSVRRGKSKGGTLSKRLEKPHSHPEQNLDLQLLASLKKVGCRRIFQDSPARAIALNFRCKRGNPLQIRAFMDPFVPSGEGRGGAGSGPQLSTVYVSPLQAGNYVELLRDLARLDPASPTWKREGYFACKRWRKLVENGGCVITSVITSSS
jgi:hypothetical protein